MYVSQVSAVNAAMVALVAISFLSFTPAARSQNVVQLASGRVIVIGTNFPDTIRVRQAALNVVAIETDHPVLGTFTHTIPNVAGLTMFLGHGNNTVTITNNLTINGDFVLIGGNHTDVFRNNPAGQCSLIVNGDFRFTGEDGEDECLFYEQNDLMYVDGDLTIETGEGSDHIQMAHLTIGGDLTVESGAGADIVNFGNDTTLFPNWYGFDVGGNVTIDTAGGEDMNSLLDCIIEGQLDADLGDDRDMMWYKLMDIGRSVSIDSGRGDDLVCVNTTSVGRNLTVDTGSDNDELNLSFSSVQNATRVYLRAGDDEIDVRRMSFGPTTFFDGGPQIDDSFFWMCTWGKSLSWRRFEVGDFSN